MTRHAITIRGPEQRNYAKRMIDAAPLGFAVIIREATRTTDQNAKLWPMLSDVSGQVEWHGTMLTAEEWKDMFTAALKRTKVIPGIDGGFVTCGLSTSRMTKADFSDLVELIYAFGAERQVRWSEPVAA